MLLTCHLSPFSKSGGSRVAKQTTHWYLPVMHEQHQQRGGYFTANMASAPSTHQAYVLATPVAAVEPAKPSVMEIELGPDQFGGDVIEVRTYRNVQCTVSTLS